MKGKVEIIAPEGYCQFLSRNDFVFSNKIKRNQIWNCSKKTQ